MNSYFTIILYVVEGSEKMLTFCIVAIFRETLRMERLRKDVFIFNLTGAYKEGYCSPHPRTRHTATKVYFQVFQKFISR